MITLAIHDIGHDAGAALFSDDHLLLAIEAERLTRRRYEPYAVSAVVYALSILKAGIIDVDVVAVSAPVRPGLVMVDDYEACLSRLRTGQLHTITTCTIMGVKKTCLLVAHEACHAAAAVGYAPNSAPALILTNEGRGLWGRSSTFAVTAGRLRLLRNEVLPWYATGFAWAALGHILGFGKSPGVAGHLMAVASYGRFDDAIAETLFCIGDDVLHDKAALRRAETTITNNRRIGRDFQATANVLATLQGLFTKAVCETVTREMQSEGVSVLGLSGGCALNINTNSAVRAAVPSVFIPPICNDSGQALGAGMYAVREMIDRSPIPFSIASNGRPESDEAILSVLNSAGLSVKKIDHPGQIAKRLADGQVVAVSRGSGELGPRALGYRSLLVSANKDGAADYVSRKLKRREWYRPLCASVTDEQFAEILPDEHRSPYMLFAYKLPEQYMPECQHVDGTCRLHTVAHHDDPWFATVLTEYTRYSGEVGLLHTSLNSAGCAIAMTTLDVLSDFAAHAVDAYVFNDYVASYG
jgi:carbamoyltransferase